jgi:hypothetical protein
MSGIQSRNSSKLWWMIPVILFVNVLLLCHFLQLYTAGLTLRGVSNEVLTKIFGLEKDGAECHNLYSSRTAVREIKIRRMR